MIFKNYKTISVSLSIVVSFLFVYAFATSTTTISSTGINTTGNFVATGDLTTLNLMVTGTTTLAATSTINGVNYYWPTLGGSGGQVLATDGNGNLSWATVSGGAAVFGGGPFSAQYFIATDTSATSTFPWLLSSRSDVGTVIGGVWNGSVIGDPYLAKSGDWTGKFDGQEGSYYLNAINLTNFGSPFYLFFNTTTTDALTQGSINRYYSTNLFASDLSGTTTTALAEGSNLYYKDSRVATYINSSTTLPIALNYWGKGGSSTYYNDGNVGIGTTSPYAKLSVVGPVVAESFNATSTGTSSGYMLNGATFLSDGGVNTNVLVGRQAGKLNGGGGDNFFGGYQAGYFSSGNNNNVLGYQAAAFNVGDNNNAFGYMALYLNSFGGGNNNNALGYQALELNHSGYNNNAFGYQSLNNNNTGDSNNAMGYQALYTNSSGYANNAFGNSALYANTSGYYNNAIGASALERNTTGSSSNAIGALALDFNTTGVANNAIGQESLYYNSTGSYNTAVGNGAGYGSAFYGTPSGNTILGYQAGYKLKGSSNVYLGYQAGYNELGSNRLYIENSNTGSSTALIYGEFDNDILSLGGVAGKVGIGTTSPYAKLSVVGPVVAEYFNATSTTATSTFSGNVNVVGNLWQNGAPLSGSQWVTSGLNIYYNTGSVGIGTTSPSDTLDVNGSITTIGVQDISKTTKMLFSSSQSIDNMEYASDGAAQSAYLNVGSITGGTITHNGSNTVHTFTSSGTFSVAGGSQNVQVLVVAGGGGAGGNGGGGGGGGGVVYNASYTASGNITVTVGQGGNGSPPSSNGSSGSDSVFGSITATGGGGGGGINNAGLNGGSGGGGGCDYGGGTTYLGGSGSQGNSGGSGDHTPNVPELSGGGGGGAGGAGQNGTITKGGDGGPGYTSSISGASVVYGSGGGGGSYAPGSNPRSIGIGGDGAGSASDVLEGVGGSGTANRGGGGGSNAGSNSGGAGGSGVVIVSYTPDSSLVAYSEATNKTQGSYSLKLIASQTDSLNKALIKTFSPNLNLTGISTLKFDLRASRTGSNIKIGIHDTGGVTTEITPNITGANIFQTVTWDLSGVSDANKDAIDSVVITVVNADAANTFYLDNMYYTASAKDIIFSTAGSETERINSSGHLGIGAASPLALLTVGSSTPAYLLSSQYYNSAYIGGQLEVGGTATSTFAGNVNVIGDLFAKTTKLGDLGFANNFKFVEDPMPINDQLVAGTQALVLKNQRGEDILKIDENGNLIVPGAISSQSLASGSPLAGGGNLIADSLSWILEQFKNIGITIADGVMSLKKLVVSDEVCIGSTCIDESQLKELINKNGIGQTPPASNEATSTTTPDIITPTEPLTTESSSTEPVSTPI